VKDDIKALADSLRGAFIDRGKISKKEIAQTLVPAYNDVKRAIEVLDENLEPPFARGMIQFSNGCKSTEAAFSRQTELEDAYNILKVRRLYAYVTCLMRDLGETKTSL
jgi:hypothetical protein